MNKESSWACPEECQSSFSINESKKVVKLAQQVFELAETVATEMLEIENKDGFNLNH